MTYDADSNVVTRKTRRGDTIAFAYDTLNRRCTKTYAASPVLCGGSSSNYLASYAYDLDGRLIAPNDNSATLTAPASAASYTTNYAYDALNRPLSASWNPAPAQATPTGSSVSFGFTYDATNRRIGQTATDKSWLDYPTTAGSTAYTANSLNQYSTVGSVSPSYDGNGNLTYDGSFTYCYDDESRLTGVISAGTCASPTTTVAAYAYDAQGRRKAKTVGGTTTVYVTDADNREVLEYNGTSGSGAPLRWYSFGLGPDNVLNQMNVAAGTRETMIPDIQASIAAMLDSGTGALSKTGYQPYGENPSLTSGTYQYTARRFDPETAGSAAEPSGLYYYRTRHYSPTLGRFLQPDPVGYAAGTNLYAYVDNDPLNYVDPSGQDALVIVGGQVPGSPNVFGHVAIAVTGGGVYSYGNRTDPGSSTSAYVSNQAATRSQTIYTIKTTPEQDAQMLTFLRSQPDIGGTGSVVDRAKFAIHNCAVLTCEALNAGGVLDSVVTARTPSAVEFQLWTSGADYTTLNVNQNTSVSSSVTKQFDPK